MKSYRKGEELVMGIIKKRLKNKSMFPESRPKSEQDRHNVLEQSKERLEEQNLSRSMKELVWRDEWSQEFQSLPANSPAS